LLADWTIGLAIPIILSIGGVVIRHEVKLSKLDRVLQKLDALDDKLDRVILKLATKGDWTIP